MSYSIILAHTKIIGRVLSLTVVQQVHLLHACACKLWWQEEVTLVGYKMQWTVRYFLHNMEVWEDRRKHAKPQGLAAYAAHKSAMWKAMATDADQLFAQVNGSFGMPLN